MKTILAMLLATICTITTTNATDHSTPSDEGWTIAASTGFVQRQTLPNGHILHQGPLAKFSIDAEMHQLGIYAHVVTQTGINEKIFEVDGVAGITNPFSLPHTDLDLRYDVNIMYDHNTSNKHDDFWRFQLKIGLDTGESQRNFRISPYASITSFLADSQSKHIKSGHVFGIGVKDIWQPTKKIEVSIPIELMYNTGTDPHGEPGLVVSAGLNVRYTITKNLSLAAGYTGYFGHENTSLWDAGVCWHF